MGTSTLTDTAAEQLSEFKNWMETRGRSEHTVRCYMGDARLFLEWAASLNRPVTQTTIEPLIAEWIKQGTTPFGSAAATVNRRMASLRLFARVNFDLDVLCDYRLNRPAAGYAHPLPNGVDDLRAMLRAAKWHHQPLIALCGFAGARVHEARKAHSQDVKIDDDGVHWILLHGKGRADRRVPLTDEAVGYLHLDQITGPLVPMSDRGARYAITATGKRAEIARNVSSHDLRMTFGTEVYRNTKDLRLTQELMGHESSHTTERYTGVTLGSMIDAVKGTFA